MKSAITFLRAVAMVGASLALTACGGDMTPDEATAVEAEALAQSEAELGSCANWSGWEPTGATTCEYRSCGYYWHCDEWADGRDTSARGDTQGESLIPPDCEDGTPPYRVYNPGTFAQQYSYRVCFDQYGNYTHTEYQYQSTLSTCGC